MVILIFLWSRIMICKRLIYLVPLVFVLGFANNSSAGLVAHWKFDNDRADSVGLLNWKLENGASYSTDSKEGSHSLSLDGVDDYAAQLAVGVLAEAFSTRTVALWFKVNVDNVTQVLYDEGGADIGLGIRINREQLQAAVRNAGIDIIASAALDSTEWTHVAVTFDNGSLSLYINGVERALASANFIFVASHKDAAGIGARNGQDAFGNRGKGDYFGGHIDDVRIYDNALSADEIEKLTAGRPATAVVQPEPEQPKAEPKKPKPIEVPPPVQPDREQFGLKSTSFEIGPELYLFEYEEPGLMKEEGEFIGVVLGLTSRGWVGSLPDTIGGFMFRAEGRFAYGQVDYEGQTWSGTPLTIENIDDFAFEGRLLLGGDILGGNTINTIYSGFGYRYLSDDLSYLRQSNYFYLPVGYQFDSTYKAGWSIGFRFEYDVFIKGIQRSRLSDVGYLDVDNEQDSGYGYRASIKIQNKSRSGSFIIEPFFRYWDIDESEHEFNPYGEFWEPANETTEIGIQIIFMF
jgi:hypothetical protein